MNKFDVQLPKALQKARWRRSDLIEKIARGEHRCDCEYCEVERDDGLADAEIEELELDLQEVEKDIDHMEKYMKVHKLAEA